MASAQALERLKAVADGYYHKYGYPVWLTGSAVRKLRPRDYDVRVVVPDAEFQERFGLSPAQYLEESETGQWSKAHDRYSDEMVKAAFDMGGKTDLNVDFRVEPETHSPPDLRQAIRLDSGGNGVGLNPGKSRKFERCVAAVATRDGSVGSPEAVCAASLRRAGWEPRRNAYVQEHRFSGESKASYRVIGEDGEVVQIGRWPHRFKRKSAAVKAAERFTGFEHRNSAEVTDRAHRYRAQQNVTGPRYCGVCGSTRFLTVDHKDGEERNDGPRNLRYLCKACNTKLGLAMARAGEGRRTRQYNPSATGAASLGEYVSALNILHGGMYGDFDKARRTIHNTPASQRSEFAEEIWRRRKRSNPAYGQYHGRNMVQEWYETASGDAKERAAELRKMGYKTSSGSSVQVTPVGRVRMTLLSIYPGSSGDADLDNLPSVRVERLNPASASDLSEAWHGRPVRRKTTVLEDIETPDEFTDLGGLEALWVIDRDSKHARVVKFGHDVRLASNPEGTQLYLVGGDQSLDLDELHVPAKAQERELVEIGPVWKIEYAADKHHLDVKAPESWVHEFGEESGEVPVLVYCRTNERMMLAGGTYEIPVDADRTSPGIVD